MPCESKILLLLLAASVATYYSVATGTVAAVNQPCQQFAVVVDDDALRPKVQFLTKTESFFNVSKNSRSKPHWQSVSWTLFMPDSSFYFTRYYNTGSTVAT